MGLSRTVSEINGDFGRKLKKNSNTRVFNTPSREVFLGIFVTAVALKKLVSCPYRTVERV